MVHYFKRGSYHTVEGDWEIVGRFGRSFDGIEPVVGREEGSGKPTAGHSNDRTPISFD